jgi:hypothetical protein
MPAHLHAEGAFGITATLQFAPPSVVLMYRFPFAPCMPQQMLLLTASNRTSLTGVVVPKPEFCAIQGDGGTSKFPVHL